MQINFSLHSIHNSEAFSFCPAAYSRFKFGDDAVAEDFGIALAKGFIEQHANALLESPQLVVISSPYAFIPTATFAMKNYFVYTLNQWLATQNRPVVQETKIHRTITYKEDYGELDAAARIKLIGNDSFHIDRTFLQGKTLLFLDDIKITGSHERMIQRMIEQYGLNNSRFLLYYAELIDRTIHPNIENHLNYYSVKSIEDLIPIIQSERFAINTRIVKYILQTHQNSFVPFIQKQSLQFASQLYNMALGNSYHTIDAYQANLSTLQQHIAMAKNLPNNKHDQ
jgi:PRTase ComF-like